MPKVVSNASLKKVPRVTKTPSVLVVDDEPEMIETFREVILAGIECKLHVARSMTEARKVLTKHPVDVMVADVMLPDGSGLDLLPELRLTSPCAAAVFMTGDPSIDHTVHALRHGAVDYITKPFTATQVTERLREIIQQQQLNARNEKRLTRLKTAVRELNKARRTVSQKVDLLCNDLVSAYGEVSSQLQTVRIQESFRRSVEQAKDLEQLLCHAMDWLLKEAGYSNIAVWLSGDDGAFELGAYMKYTVVGERKTTLALQEAIVQPTAREGFLHLSDGELSHMLNGAEKKLLPNQTLMSASCTYLGESLAVVALFRDGKCPFRDEDAAMLRAVATVFATQLATMVNAAPDESEHESQDGESSDDAHDTPWNDSTEPPKNKGKQQHESDWWKRGEPPPF